MSFTKALKNSTIWPVFHILPGYDTHPVLFPWHDTLRLLLLDKETSDWHCRFHILSQKSLQTEIISCHAFLNSDHHKPFTAEQHNVLLTLHPGLAHFVWCALILREIGLILESGKMDYFGSTMLQTIQKVMWLFTLQGLFQNCNISLLLHILLSNNTDQIVKEYSFSLLFQNLFSDYAFILLSGMSTTTCVQVHISYHEYKSICKTYFELINLSDCN